MARQTRHIIKIGHQKFAAESMSAATQAVAVLAKLKKVRLDHSADDSDNWFYYPEEEEEGFHDKIELQLNQKYRDSKTDPKAKKKALALPAPKRGTIMCICEKSYVAPKQTCPHCGRSFSESHNRTHGDSAPIHPTLRIL